MKNIQVRPRKGRRPFSYTDKPSPRCRRVVLSDRAYLSVLAEVLSWGGQETGGILFGQVHRGAWYVVEASDPGYPGKTVHTPCYHEMDPEYYNHLYPVPAACIGTICLYWAFGTAIRAVWTNSPGWTTAPMRCSPGTSVPAV